MVAIFIINDTEIRDIENDELSHEVDAIVGEWDILEFYYTYWFTNTCIEKSKFNRLEPNLKIPYTL